MIVAQELRRILDQFSKRHKGLTVLWLIRTRKIKCVKNSIHSVVISPPGMVLTDLLLLDASPVAKGFFNALAEEPETVAATIVPQIRSLNGTSQNIEFLTPLTSISRVILGIPQILFGGRFFGKNGDRIENKAEKYKSNGVRILYEIDDDKY